MNNILGVDAVYVLSVETFTDRITHIQQEFQKHHIDFEFIFDYDIVDLTPELIHQTFDLTSATARALTPAHQSLILKHIASWQRAVDQGHKRILVFEDDVVLHRDFNQELQKVLRAAGALTPAYLIFLGGADNKVPSKVFLETAAIFKQPLSTAEAYITDFAASQKRLEWLTHHLVDLPADHLIKKIDDATGIAQYWSVKPLVEQGSLFGMFSSTLDAARQKTNTSFTRWRYRWKKFRKKTVHGFFVRLFAKIKGPSS